MSSQMSDETRRANIFLTLGLVLLIVATILLFPAGGLFTSWGIIGLVVIAGGSLVAVAAMREAVAEFLPPAPEIWFCRLGALPVIVGIIALLDFIYAWVSPWPPRRTNPVALTGMICVIDAFILLAIAAPTIWNWFRECLSEDSPTIIRPSARPPVGPPSIPFDFAPSRREEPVFRPDDRSRR